MSAQSHSDQAVREVVRDVCVGCGRPWDGRTLPASHTKAWCPRCEAYTRFEAQTFVPKSECDRLRTEVTWLRNQMGDVRGMQSDGATPEEMDHALGRALCGDRARLAFDNADKIAKGRNRGQWVEGGGRDLRPLRGLGADKAFAKVADREWPGAVR